MQPRRHHTGARAGSHARSAGQPRIDAVDNAHRRHRAAQRKAAIGSEIGKIENAERNQHPQRHQRINQAAFNSAE